MDGRCFMPAKQTGKKTTKTESVSKKGKKVKHGQAYECGICGFRLIVDECGCVEEHYLICCKEAMTQKKTKAQAKKTAPKVAKKADPKAKKKAAPKTTTKTKKKK